MPRSHRAAANLYLALLAALVWGCSSSESPTEPEPGPDVTVASVTIAPETVSLAALGDTIRFTGTAQNAAGEVVPASVTWSSTHAEIVSVDTTGLAESVRAGTAAIIATAEGFADTAAVTVTLRTLVWAAGVDGSWHDPGNWRGGVVPTAVDTAEITAAGDYQVTMAGDATVARLVLGTSSGTQQLDATSGALSVASMVMDGAELQIGSAVGVAETMEWRGGVVAGAGTLTLADGAELLVGGGAPIPRLETTLINGGTLAVVSGTRFDVAIAGLIQSPVGSLIDFRSDGSILPYGGGVVESAGDVVKSAGFGVSAFGSAGEFIVTGSMRIETGALRIAGGQVLGPVDIAPDARLEALGSITLAGDVSFLNSGPLDIEGSVTVGLEAGQTITIPYLTVHTGSLGGVADIAVTDSLVWIRGDITGEGEIRIDAAATARLVGDDFSKTLAGRDLHVYGDLTAGSGLDLLLDQGAAVMVENTGRWEQGFGGRIRQNVGSGSSFRMDGVFTKRDAETFTVEVPMTCSGSLLLDDGVLVLTDAFTLTETGLIRGGGLHPLSGYNLRLDLSQAIAPILGGTIEPDHDGQPARLDIAGGGTMTATTVVRIDLAEAGEIRGERLIFSEGAIMGGTLVVTNSLELTELETFKVVSMVQGGGTFATIIGAEEFGVRQDTGGVWLDWPPPR